MPILAAAGSMQPQSLSRTPGSGQASMAEIQPEAGAVGRVQGALPVQAALVLVPGRQGVVEQARQRGVEGALGVGTV